MTPFITYEKMDLPSLINLREFIENNYSAELHDIWDKVNDELKYIENQLNDALDELEDLKNVGEELINQKDEITNLIKDKDLLEYNEFVEELERIVF